MFEDSSLVKCQMLNVKSRWFQLDMVIARLTFDELWVIKISPCFH